MFCCLFLELKEVLGIQAFSSSHFSCMWGEMLSMLQYEVLHIYGGDFVIWK